MIDVADDDAVEAASSRKTFYGTLTNWHWFLMLVAAGAGESGS
jgi:hypothetical protein